MRNHVLTGALLAALTWPAITFGATFITCELCRSPYDYPMDYGNHVYNQTFGSNPTLSLDQANRILVRNPAGQWAVVDIDIVLVETGVLAELGWFGISLSIPDGRLEISVQDPSGTMTDYLVFIGSPDLNVGDTPPISEIDSGSTTAEPAPEEGPSTESSETNEVESAPTSGGIETTTAPGPADYGQEGTWYWYQDSWSSADGEYDYQIY
jgi:hypothetical protein